MRVEVEVSDLAEGTYFIDERCGAVEAVLRKGQRYGECVVKRQHFGGDHELDPFVIQDFEGRDLTLLDTWAFDALDDSELLSFVDVQICREGFSHERSLMFLVLCVILVGPSAAVFSIMALFISPTSTSPILSSIAVVTSLLVLISVANYYKRRRDAASKKRHIDLVAARESLSFLDALRKLASLPQIDEGEREGYLRRLKNIEDELHGVT
jgi:hypothetical protein